MTACDESSGGGREGVLRVTGRGFDVFVKDPVEVCLSRLRTEIHLTARPALDITSAATDCADEAEIILILCKISFSYFQLVYLWNISTVCFFNAFAAASPGHVCC